MPLATIRRARVSAGAHIDDIVGVSDHVKVVLDDDDGRAVIQQRLKNTEQHANIQRMQADRRLIEHKDGVRLRSADLAGELLSRCASPPDRLGVSSPSVR